MAHRADTVLAQIKRYKDDGTSLTRLTLQQAEDLIVSQQQRITALEDAAQRDAQQIADLRDLKSGYYDAMLAWRRQAEDGVPVEDSLARKSAEPASPDAG